MKKLFAVLACLELSEWSNLTRDLVVPCNGFLQTKASFVLEEKLRKI
jgi:hypothetical protein